jgi:hypothetical protein
VFPVRYGHYQSRLIKDRTIDNVQNCDIYMNIPSSQTGIYLRVLSCFNIVIPISDRSRKLRLTTVGDPPR